MVRSMPHFFASDLLALAIAFLLGIPVILIPGYGIGWWLNLFDFRSEPAATRWSWSLAFGLTMEPILLYIPFRLVSANGMWCAFASLLLAGVVALIRKNPIPRWREVPFAARIATSTVLALGCFLMLDVVTSTGVYPPTQVIDTSFRSQVITSLATADHLPPRSLFFNPGHPTILKYHYVFFLISGLMMRLGAGLVTARMALVSLALWVGLAMLVAIAITGRFFWLFADNARATRIAWALLLVGGLDILPVGSEALSRWLAGEPHPIPYADVNFWNGWGMAFDWINTLIWSSHHLAGLMACLLGCLFLWQSRNQRGVGRWIAALATAVAFASAAGSSIYVTGIFAAFLFIVAIEVLLNAPRFAVPLIFAGVLAGILSTTFLLDMRTFGAPGGASVFEFAARPFQPVIFLFDYLNIKSALAWNLAYIATLPLNYLLEFGFFLVAGIWWFCRERDEARKVQHHLIGGLATISLLLPAIIWSGMEYSNDFGYRGVLPAQFVLLLCGAEFLENYGQNTRHAFPVAPRIWQIAVLTLILGLATNASNILLTRTSIGNFQQGTVLPGQMLRFNHSPESFRDLRAAYVWLQQNTSSGVIVQENPVTWQLLAEGEYSQRPTVVYGTNPSFMIGVDHTEYLEVLSRIRKIFEFGTSTQESDEIAASYGIDYLVVQNSDPVWADRKSYVWTRSAVFETPFVRVIRCRR
jgi:hypothetical protein